MLTTEADLICCSSRVCGAASASPARWMIVSTDPVESSTPNSSRASSVVSRRETRFLTASVTSAACSLGPNADRGTAREARPRVWVAHAGTDPVQPMLGHPDSGRRQLRDLVPPRLRRLDQLGLGEHVRARPAALRPMLDDLVDPLGRKQPPVPALVPGLTTTLLDPTPSHPVAAAPTEDPARAAATSSANSGSAAAQAQQPEPRAAGSPQPAARSLTNSALPADVSAGTGSRRKN